GPPGQTGRGLLPRAVRGDSRARRSDRVGQRLDPPVLPPDRRIPRESLRGGQDPRRLPEAGGPALGRGDSRRAGDRPLGAAAVLGLTAASAALTMSQVPWNGPIAAVRVGRVEGAWILNPTFQQLEFSDVDMVVSGSKDSIVMVEGGALELTEAEIVKCLEVAHKGIRELLDAANELVADMRQPKMEW